MRIRFWSTLRYKCYLSIDFCPVWNFFKALETEDPRYILILNNYSKLPKFIPSEEWNNLLLEYQEATSKKSFAFNQLYSNVLNLRKKFFLLSNSYLVLCYKKDENLIKVVSDLGYKFDKENYQESLNYLNRQMQGLKKSLDLKISEMNDKLKRNSKKTDIYQVLNTLESYKGIKLDPFKLSVREFITISQAYEAWVNKENDARRKNRA